MTHAERLRAYAQGILTDGFFMCSIKSLSESAIAGADALERLASLPHYDDCDKWVLADAPDGCDVVMDETRECTCALGSTRGHRRTETGQGGTNGGW